MIEKSFLSINKLVCARRMNVEAKILMCMSYSAHSFSLRPLILGFMLSRSPIVLVFYLMVSSKSSM